MTNIARFYSSIMSVIRRYVLCSLVLPLCAQAQEGKTALTTRLQWPDIEYLEQNTNIDTLIDQALIFEGNNKIDSALWLLTQTSHLSGLLYYPQGLAESQSYIGRMYFQKNELELSKAYFYKALPYLQQSGTLQRMLAYVYNALGTVYVRQGVRDSAIRYYYRSLEVAERLTNKDSLLMAMIYSNIAGGVLLGYAGYSGKKEQVMYYLNIAKPMAAAIGNKGTLISGNIYINTGMVYDRIDNDTALALVNYRSGLNLLRTIKAKGDMQNAYFLIAALYADRKSYDQAKPYIDSGIAIDKEGFSYSVWMNQLLANYFLYKKDYPQSLFYFNRAMDICDAIGSDNFKLTLYYFRAQLYSKMGLGLKAYEDQKRHSDLLDSLMNKQKIETVDEMEIRYRTAEKDKKLLQGQLQLKQKEARIREKNIWVAGIALSAAFALIFIIIRYRHKQRLLAQQQEIALLSSRMHGEDLERSRIARELHDGVSVLLSAAKMNYTALGKENQALAQTEAFNEVMILLNQTVQEVRSISHNLVPGLLIHQSLPGAVQAFCELVRKGYNLHIELLAYGSFTATDTEWNYTIYRMIQELIHNVIKHAKATEVLIQLTLHQDKLHLTVEDNGVGFVEEKSVMGLGLQSLRQRVEKMQGQLLFSSKPSEGTTVEIEIPVIAS